MEKLLIPKESLLLPDATRPVQCVEISKSYMRKLIDEWHYLKRPPPMEQCFGLYTDKELIAAVAYGTSPAHPMHRSICGRANRKNVLELVRLCLKPRSVTAMQCALLIMNTITEVKKEVVVVYLDTDESVQNGDELEVFKLITPPFVYVGLSEERTDVSSPEDPKGKRHPVSIAGQYTADDMLEQFGSATISEKRTRKHRFVYFNCSGNRRNELISQLNRESYPPGPPPWVGLSSDAVANLRYVI